jgi:hypothetical protein
MGIVDVIFKSNDGVFDINYAKTYPAYRIDEENILHEDDNGLVIDAITSETEEGIIVQMDEPERIIPIFIDFQNIYDIDYTHESVINFAKYLIQIRDGE